MKRKHLNKNSPGKEQQKRKIQNKRKEKGRKKEREGKGKGKGKVNLGIRIEPESLGSKTSENLRMFSTHSHGLFYYANPCMFIKSPQTQEQLRTVC